jgi:ABC-type uncharacterized transport system auxiliary subunit
MRAFVYGAVAAVFSLSVAMPAAAADQKFVFPEEAKTVEGGRDLRVLVSQTELKSDINQSNIVVATGGGLLGALIDAKVNADRAKRAEIAIQPMRVALTGYDVDTLAVDTTKAVVAKAAWFQAPTSTFGRDNTPAGKTAALDAATTGQLSFFEYTYDASPDFSSIRVSLNIQLANKAPPAGKDSAARLAPKYLVYNQTVTSVITLPSPSKEETANAARWSKDDGKLARKALAEAFDEVSRLAPRALDIKTADVKPMNARDKKFVALGGYAGRVQEETPEGTLLFSNVLVRVKTLAE